MKDLSKGLFRHQQRPLHTMLSCALALSCFSLPVYAEDTVAPLQSNQYFDVQTVATPAGDTLVRTIISGPPTPPPGFELQRTPVSSLPEPNIEAGINILSNVPAFNWSFGCSATSAAMIAGYYDRTGYGNMYAGPTNGGVMPLNNSSWPDWTDSKGASRHQCPLSATHNGLDGRAIRGHVDDYWTGYGDAGPDPWDGHWTQHTKGECTADYMNTNQWVYPGGGWNTDGSTIFYTYNDSTKLNCSEYTTFPMNTRGDIGVQSFYQSRGYTMTECYTQKTDNDVAGGFSFDNYKTEIDAGRPVMFHVTGHTMIGFGYDTTGNTMYIHDTWDYSNHTMTWGGSYSGMTQYAVTIVKLAPVAPTTYTLNVNSSGASAVAITASPTTYAGTTNYSKTAIPSGTNITLTAPATASGLPFTTWSGCTSVNNRVCTVNMTGNKAVVVRYGTPSKFPWPMFLPAIIGKKKGAANLFGSWNKTFDWGCNGVDGTAVNPMSLT